MARVLFPAEPELVAQLLRRTVRPSLTAGHGFPIPSMYPSEEDMTIARYIDLLQYECAKRAGAEERAQALEAELRRTREALEEVRSKRVVLRDSERAQALEAELRRTREALAKAHA